MKRMVITHTILAAVTVALMALPFGVNCYYASPENGGVDFSAVHTVSFFDMRLFDFQNPLPFVTALAAVALLALSVWRLTAYTKTLNVVSLGGSALVLVLSVLPLLLFGTEYYSTVAMTASFTLLCMAVIDLYIVRGKLLYTPKTKSE